MGWKKTRALLYSNHGECFLCFVVVRNAMRARNAQQKKKEERGEGGRFRVLKRASRSD